MRLQRRANLLRALTVLAFVAQRLLQLREADGHARSTAERPCSEVLGELEWRLLWVSCTGKEPPGMAWAYRALAKLGGFLNTKRSGRAGWATMWDGAC